MAARLPAALLLLLLLLAAAVPAALANFVTVTGSIYCDVDKSGTVSVPPDRPAINSQLKIFCITGPNSKSTRYATTDANGNHIFNMTIPNVNSTQSKFMGCTATLVNTANTTCAMPGPCNNGSTGEPV
eukprot:SM000120S25683  [mRNA]  locus=s120:31600:32437:- [translate_table: standard]